MHPDKFTAFPSDESLARGLTGIVERATHRQFWTFFLDDAQRILDPIMPMDDHPESPHEIVHTHEADGERSWPVASVLASRMLWIAETIGAASIVFVWERPGGEKFEEYELEWARAMHHEFAGSRGVRLRAQFLLHDTGVRLLTQDDYA